MDVTSFSNDSFDTKQWINNILKDESDRKENHSMSLVVKLQLYVQKVNNSLEETSQQVLSSLPKIMRDTRQLQEEAHILKEKMTIIKREVAKIEEETGESIKSIENLDKIKTKLSEAKQGLHESDNWMLLVNDLEEVFDSKNIETITNKLQSMQQSLKLLINVADYDERKIQLEGLKNRLEAIASPSIVQAFTTNNIQQAQLYVKTFESIDRQQELIKYYQKCQKDLLMRKWREQFDNEQDESVQQLIHNYYNVLLSNWHAQQKYYKQIFQNEQKSSEILVEIYIDVLISLKPSINECIDTILKQTNDKLLLLHEIKIIIKQFSENMREIVNVRSDKLHQLQKAIFTPLKSYVTKYAAYEQAYLTQKLTSLECLREDIPETIERLGLLITTVIDMAREAKRRCADITENCGFHGLLIALKAFFNQFNDQFRLALRQIERRREYREDWPTFQLCLSLLQNGGDLLNNLHAFEKELTNTILSDTKTINAYKSVLLDGAGCEEIERLIKSIIDGTQLSLLDCVLNEYVRLCRDLHEMTYQVVLTPIVLQFDVMQDARMWTGGNAQQIDLPDYGLSPQEYITQIGQYLMTLPQHLEPFLFSDNPSLSCALKSANDEYTNSATETHEGAAQMADVFLRIVASGSCQMFCERILSICELSNAASRQLAQDICYFGNVLEDLGLNLSENLQHIVTLLKLPSDQYHTQSAGCPAKYVAAIRQMRNITYSG